MVRLRQPLIYKNMHALRIQHRKRVGLHYRPNTSTKTNGYFNYLYPV
jgi:hypothetical protein